MENKQSPDGVIDPSLLEVFASKVIDTDRFGQRFHFKVHRQKSLIGTLCTLVFGLILLVYVLTKAQTWTLRNFTDIIDIPSATYDNMEKFTAKEHGFFVAAALTQYGDAS